MSNDIDRLDQLAGLRESLYVEIGKRIVGQRQVIDQLLITLFAGGHGLLEGVPGLAKTLLISTVARALDLQFKRIQFTPDLMPSDITGSEVLEEDQSTGNRVFRFLKGPIFANIVLADEINRTPPKTQAALLQAMQEREVTIGGDNYPLSAPFFVLATQNPIEQEGTYPLPEAQLDRFMFNIKIDYPDREDEVRIMRRTTGVEEEELRAVVTGEEILAYQKLVRGVPVADNVLEYAVELVRRTRNSTSEAHPKAKEFLSWGAGPRAAQCLVLGAKAWAALEGRPTPSLDDVRSVAPPVLRHRLVTNFHAEAEGVSRDDLIAELVESLG
ncbi:MAG TPA: MoxR family ATPase [Candidatus Krumholzibacteria bacterium]